MFPFCPECGATLKEKQSIGQDVICPDCGFHVGSVTAAPQKVMIDQAQEIISQGTAARCPLCQQLVELKGQGAARSYVPHFTSQGPRKMCPSSGKPVTAVAPTAPPPAAARPTAPPVQAKPQPPKPAVVATPQPPKPAVNVAPQPPKPAVATPQPPKPAVSAPPAPAQPAAAAAPAKKPPPGKDLSAWYTKDVIRVVFLQQGANPSIEELNLDYLDKTDRVKLQLEALENILGRGVKPKPYPSAFQKAHLGLWSNASGCVIAKLHPQGGYQAMSDAELMQAIDDYRQNGRAFFA